MFHCLSPITVPDKAHPGRFIKVPCGHCASCVNKRSLQWSSRIEVEASQHKYVFFVTLTYSDKFVPLFYPEEVLDYPYVTEYQRIKLIDYIQKNKVSDKYLVLRYSDIQNFLKRLRNYIYEDNKVSEEQKVVRYYCCGEYGETTFRPHYHFIFFVDSDRIGQCIGKSGKTKFESYIHKAWSVPSENKKYRIPIGRIDCQFVRDNAAKYCSSYVSSFAYIPAFLRTNFAPFCRASKAPPIGSFKFDVSQAKQIVVGGYNEFTNFQGDESKGNVNIPLFKSLKDSLFPRIPCYSLLSDVGRFAVYGAARFPYVGASYSEFREYLYENQERPLTKLLLNIIDSKSVGDLYQINDKQNRSLVRIWRLSSRVLVNCSIFGIPLHDYVDYIDKFYSNCDYENLKNQLQFEEVWSIQNDIRYLPSFIDESVFGWQQLWSCKTLESFGLKSDSKPDSFDFFDTLFFKNYKSKKEHIVNIGKSYKAKKDYEVHGHLSNLNVI